MKQNMFKTLVLTGASMICGTALPASAAQTLHVNVPFAFMAGGAQMTPGEYNVTESGNGMVTLIGSKCSAMFLTVPSDFNNAGPTALSFTSNDSSRVLTGIQITGSMSREVPIHETEKKVVLTSSR